MLDKVITILSISVTICLGNIMPHIGQEHPQDQAISSVTFQRQDVPMAYKYSSYHPIYQNDDNKPLDRHPNRTPSPILRSIQYAPLIKPGELQLQNTKFNKVPNYNQHMLLDYLAKKNTKHLEPKLEELPAVPSVSSGLPSVHDYQSYPLAHLDYIPGHNIQVLRSVNRSPGHNAVYRSYTDRSPQPEKQNKINHLSQYIIHPNNQRPSEYSSTRFWINAQTPTESSASISTTPSTTTTTTATTTTTSTKPSLKLYPYKQPKQYYIPKPITYIVEKPVEKSPYTKMHSLLLNVARSYNLALAPHRALHAGASPTLLGKLHQHQNHQPLMKVPGSSDLHAPITDPKTVLYPVQKNLHFTMHS